MLSSLPPGGATADLLVGNATSDDAAVLRIDGTRAIVQTVDFFTPIVDDPRLFGQIAAANAISDIYAMGAEPILGLAIAAFPSDKLPLEVLAEILAGGEEKAREAGFPIAGGHTIIDEIPKYGVAVTGIVDVDRIVRNSTAREGDLLYLTKPIGNGILICAHRNVTTAGTLKKLVSRPTGPDLEEAISWMVALNRGAARAMTATGVTAATDVTGYGLVGHLLEMCLGSNVGAEVSVSAVPLLGGVREWLAKGFVPDGTKRNVETFRAAVTATNEDDLTLLCDAQTSGGLMITVDPSAAGRLEAAFRESGLLCARIGRMTGEAGRIAIVP